MPGKLSFDLNYIEDSKNSQTKQSTSEEDVIALVEEAEKKFNYLCLAKN